MTIDLNCDLGEGFGAWSMGDYDAQLDIVTSANIACGFHAGDPSIMRRTCIADRAYTAQATLAARTVPGSVPGHDDAIAQALSIATTGAADVTGGAAAWSRWTPEASACTATQPAR